MRNVISFHRNTANVYIHNITSVYAICYSYNQHQDIYACSWIWFCFFGFFFACFHITKRSWNLCISHVLKWQNDGAQLYLLSDAFDTHTIPYICYTLNDFFLSAILFIVFVVVSNEIFWPFEWYTHTTDHTTLLPDPCGWHSLLASCLSYAECGF